MRNWLRVSTPYAVVFLGGALFAHGLDAPHMAMPAQLRDAANVIQATVILLIKDRQPATRADWHGSMISGSWNVAVGSCAGGQLTTQNRSLLLGDNTSTIGKRDGFVNLGNRFCFWRDSGIIVDCPPPEHPC